MTDKTKKSGEPRRELLNLGIVAVPSNREAIILDSKALDVRAEEIVAERAAEAEMKAPDVKDSPKPYGDVHYADPSEGKYPIDTVEHIRAALRFIGVAHNRELLGDHLASTEAAIHAAARAHGIDPHSNGKSSEMVETKETKSPAIYVDIVPRFDYDGFAANLKAAMTASGIGGDGALVQAIHDASSHLGAACPVIEVTDEGDGAPDGANKSLELQESETFEKRLDKILTESGSPEAPAPTDMVPAPASPDDDAEIKARAMRMGLGLLTTISN